MKPRAFQYFRPDSVEEAVGLLRRHEAGAKLLAGGQSLVPLMNYRLAGPSCLVDLNGTRGLDAIREVNGALAIGAMVRQSAIEDSALLADRCPLLVQATRLIGHRTIRNLGTIGGSLAHADPSAELPAALVALDGEVRVRGPAGERAVPAGDLFLSVCTTSLAPTEVITEVRVPVAPAGSGTAFLELCRRHGDFAIVGVAVQVTRDGSDVAGDVRIALVGVDRTPIRCHGAEACVRGTAFPADLIRAAAEEAAAAARPVGDVHATAAYRRSMVRVFVARALTHAWSRCARRADAS